MGKRREKKLLHKYAPIGFVFLLFTMFFTFSIDADGQDTIIQVLVSNNPIVEGDMVNISLYCIPGQPIKAFELSVYFNASLLKVNKIVEGTIFNGYDTFYHNGTFDNNNGEIRDIYDLIIGVGNVSSSGYLVNISFTTLSMSGDSQIQLVNVGVTNETYYVPIFVINGSVSVIKISPTIDNIYLNASYPIDTDALFGWINISCTVYDDNIRHVKIIIIRPNGSSENLSMTHGSKEEYFYNTSFSAVGKYTIRIWFIDFDNYSNCSEILEYVLTPNWDINFDCVITVIDLILISNHFNEQGAPGWIREDVDNNGHIEVLDVVLAANHYNDCW